AAARSGGRRRRVRSRVSRQRVSVDGPRASRHPHHAPRHRRQRRARSARAHRGARPPACESRGGVVGAVLDGIPHRSRNHRTPLPRARHLVRGGRDSRVRRGHAGRDRVSHRPAGVRWTEVAAVAVGIRIPLCARRAGAHARTGRRGLARDARVVGFRAPRGLRIRLPRRCAALRGDHAAVPGFRRLQREPRAAARARARGRRAHGECARRCRHRMGGRAQRCAPGDARRSRRRNGAPHARARDARGPRGLHSPLTALLQHTPGSAARAVGDGGRGRLMRAALVLAALALGASAAPAQRDSTWRDHDRAAHKAYTTGDFATFRAQLLAMRREIGPLPAIDYDLAVAEARLGNGERALEWLQTFADMGLFQDAERDADLASVRSLPGYPRVMQRVTANLEPVTRGAVAFTLADADLVADDSAGRASDFTRAGSDSTWGIFAVHVDAARQLLWATTAATPAAQGYARADSGRSALLAYDLATGVLRARLDPPDPRRAHVLGDITVGADGTVYVSDAASGAVYVATPGARALAVLVPPGTFTSPQTPALSADEKRLFVADYARGVAVIDLSSRGVSWLGHPGNVALAGTDGLYRVGNTLLAVQNGTTPNRVVRALLDTAMTRVLDAQVLERAKPAVSDPTHGVIVGDTFYFIARSGWDRVHEDGTIAPAGADDAPQIRRLTLLAYP